MSKIEQRLPDDWHPDTWSRADQEQDEDVFTGVAPTFIALLAEAAAVALFVGMVAVWAAIGSGA